jgi:hypothetical protein
LKLLPIYDKGDKVKKERWGGHVTCIQSSSCGAGGWNLKEIDDLENLVIDV